MCPEAVANFIVASDQYEAVRPAFVANIICKYSVPKPVRFIGELVADFIVHPQKSKLGINMKKVLLLCVVVLAGCAANSGVVPMGEDRFMVSRQAATGFSGSGTLKAEALKEADEHCKKINRVLVVRKVTEAKPPYILGNYPKAEIEFSCVARSAS